jgi:hypothetical protein
MSLGDEIERLVRQINASPDKLHGDYTPAVLKLIEIGEPALPAVLPLMVSEERETRLRAQRVLEGVTMAMFGFRIGHGWTRPGGEEAWRRLWDDLGGVSAEDSPERRAQAVDRWTRWLRGKTAPP